MDSTEKTKSKGLTILFNVLFTLLGAFIVFFFINLL